MTWKITLVIACLLAGAAVYILYPKMQSEPEEVMQIPAPVPEPESEVVETPEPADTLTEPEEPVTPPKEELEPLIDPPAKIDGSDPQVLKVVAEIAPKLSTWLIPEQQIRKWVLTIDLLANGELPKKYPPLNFPMSPFRVQKSDAVIKTDEANFSRVEPLVKAITEIDPKLIARYYEHWLPTLEMAYKEQGKPGSFDQRFRQAIEQFLSVEPLPKTASLKQPHVFYQYTDSDRERRKDLDKLMWRLGEANMNRIQIYLQELQVYL